ncbi:MAG: HAMP domain-containing histidine kinase [Gammaproteobacteria bacterium]|nr:HAMP domain-containing histidine kinase [Gammaproteobacteria bacterium]MBU1731501.1 HAMP domain-containing histidine kinase [Gammaproteobacteria bacterium]MBU1893006.1 HAMP domain-containing histidine kinase [Gammaproteobacteria bacterium]
MAHPDYGEIIPPEFDEAVRELRLAFLKFGERDVALLNDLAGLFRERAVEISERFYEHMLAFEDTRKVFRDEAMIQRLKEAQAAYLMKAVEGPYDLDYFQRRWRIGYIHNAIMVEPHWFIGAFQLYHRILYPIILEHYRDDAQAVVDHILALDKIMNLDLQLGIQSYYVHYEGTMDKLRELNLRIEATSTAKSQFLANMSHEFRTPLNAIIGFTEVLQDRIPGELNAEQEEYLGDIHDAGQLLLRLINDVLDISKVEAGRLELFYETFPIAQTVRETITTLRGAAEKKKLVIHGELPPDLGLITADQIRFKQILFNLLSNAVKFTDSGAITLSAKLENGQLHLMVADTGIGIKEEDMSRIFIEFSQVDASNSRRYQGTGLGLALSRRLTEAHGGSIWAESRFGEGSVFHVLLPLQPDESRDTRDQVSQ